MKRRPWNYSYRLVATDMKEEWSRRLEGKRSKIKRAQKFISLVSFDVKFKSNGILNNGRIQALLNDEIQIGVMECYGSKQ